MPSSNPVLDTSSPAFTEALDASSGELAALSEAQLESVTFNIEAAVLTALGAAPGLLALRPAMVARFGEAKASIVDRVERVARAAGKAETLHIAYLKGTTLEPLSKAVVHERTLLVLDAQSLVQRRLLDPARIAGLRGVAAYADQCFDVIQLAAVYREEWAGISAHTPVKVEDLDRAEAVANQLAVALGERQHQGGGGSPTADLRQRAYTLLVRTYDQTRRMVSYLRWHQDDVDTIAPSLWAGRKARRDDEDEDDEVVVPPT